uniref:Uncharacterized protein n=1 Tax=Mycena chlorophos TaxID=658473 RepID=A0ABQ0KVV4_MYCCL|nr:predicted protein [Mycena chlorophos]
MSEKASAQLTKTAASSNVAYVYYRLYAPDGPMLVKQPCVPGNSYIGRIAASSIPPPHIAETVKRRILANEGRKEDTTRIANQLIGVTASIFETVFEESALSAHAAVGIPGVSSGNWSLRGGVGRTAESPVAVVFENNEADYFHRVAAQHGGLSPTSVKSSDYLFYHLYTPDGEGVSKKPITTDKPAIGSIPKNFIPAPHFASSIRRCIAAQEDFIYAGAKVFKDIGDTQGYQIPDRHGYLLDQRRYVSREQHIDLGKADSVGTLDKPIVLVAEESKAAGSGCVVQ